VGGCFRLDVRPLVDTILPYVTKVQKSLNEMLPSLVVLLCERLCVRLETHIMSVCTFMLLFFI
jgi:mannose/fructose/N-acetylgalactosamine-specific phosphotransferase system component IID